ncbi:MAG: helix-turn-helix domain-containing protein [Planctomycetota bacterium]
MSDPTRSDSAVHANGLSVVTPRSKPLAVDVVEAAEMLRVSVKTVRREIQSGNLPALRIGRYLRVRVAALELYLRERELVGPVVSEERSV